MCSIFGAFGEVVDEATLRIISDLAADRGRDAFGVERYSVAGREAVIGNYRAAPTTELSEPLQLQPYDGIVHNGTVANDVELGLRDGEVDSQVLPRVISRESLASLAVSLEKVKGSFAIAVVSDETVFLACNYKPIYYLKRDRCVYFSSMERHLLPVCTFGVAPCRMKPYTALDLRTGETVSLKRTSTRKAVVVCSAGLDSTVAACKLLADGYDVHLLHFRYRCLAERSEADRIHRIAERLACPLTVLDLDYTAMTGDSPLFKNGDAVSGGIEGAEYANEWVPARNLVMLSHAVAFAESSGASVVAIGNNLEESGAYPDNEEEFTNLFSHAVDYAVHDGFEVKVFSPLGNLMKHEIVKLGKDLNAPLDLTWSCYKEGESHCGECGPCFMRKTAFERNGLVDPAFT